MMPSLAPSVLTGVVDAAIRALVFAGVMGIALIVFRVTGAAARLWVWTLVLVAALAMPILGRALPGMRWTIPGSAPIERWLRQAAPTPQVNAAPTPPNAGPRVDQPNSASAIGSPSLIASLRATWPFWTLGIYLTGVFLLLLRMAMSWRVTRCFERSAGPIRDRAALDRLQWHVARSGLARAPALAESSALRVPVTMSVLTPAIVLPAGWRAWTRDQLDAVLAHEMAHVARRDTLTQRVSLFYRALAWFSPLSWWLHHRLAELAEQASDEAALEAGADRTAYAETLLAFFADLQHAPRGAGWHVAMARGTVVHAERRLERILSWKGDRAMKLTTRLITGLVLAAAPAAVLTAAVRPVLATAPTVASTAIAPPETAPSAPLQQGVSAGPVYAPGHGVTNATLIKTVEPSYTPEASQARLQGDVELTAVILPDGTVGELSLIKSLDRKLGLDAEAIEAAKQWRFRPATKDGQPVAVQVTLVLTFRLPKDATAPADPVAQPGPRRGGGAYLPGAGVTGLPASTQPTAAQTPDDEFTRGAYPENTPGLVAPRVTFSVEPKYTSDALRAKIQGVVLVDVVVGTDGTVARARVAQSLDKDLGLDEEALKAAKQWVFEPGFLNGQKVPVIARLTLLFRIH